MAIPLASPLFQSRLEAIAKAHGLDLSNTHAYLELSNEPYERLIIERLDAHHVTVTHLYDDGDVDLRVVFFTSTAGWFAISNQNWMGTRTFAWLDENGQRLARFMPAEQQDIARFCNGVWARNLKEQGYTEATMVI